MADCPSLVKFCQNLTEVKVFIEQSLSDFGDADAILLLDAGDKKGVVFLEAKVKSSQRNEWKLEQEFEKFISDCNKGDKKLSSSNLFTQLYHKHRFLNGLSDIEALKKGIDFPKCSTKETRKIGNNPVVLHTVKKIEPYVENAWYIALVPDTSLALRDFYSDFRKNDKEEGILSKLDRSRWGGLTWEQVAEFCKKFELKNTKQVLDFNKGQIY